MVLAAARGGAGAAGASPRRGEPGSQTLELALVVPAVVLLLVVLVHAALVGMDLVAVQGMAREAARIAAVDDDRAALDALRQAAGNRPVRAAFAPAAGRRRAGQTVRARVELRSRGFAAFGVPVWLPAEATMRVEDT